MASDSVPVVHSHIALMLCDSAAVLEETLAQIDLSDFPYQRLGDRALVAPATVVEMIRERLRDKGIYPRIVGDIVRDVPDIDEETDEETDEDAAEEEEEA